MSHPFPKDIAALAAMTNVHVSFQKFCHLKSTIKLCIDVVAVLSDGINAYKVIL